MNRCIIIGNGESVNLEKIKSFDGTIICCDAIFHLIDDIRKVDYVVTLEDDSTYTKNFFSGNTTHDKPIVITSPRTRKEVIELLETKKYNIQKFNEPLLHICWTVGNMAWLYAWKELGFRYIELTGFDSLRNCREYKFKMAREMFYEMLFDYSPKGLVTKMDNFEFKERRTGDGYTGFSDINRYVNYRIERDNKIFKTIYDTSKSLLGEDN